MIDRSYRKWRLLKTVKKKKLKSKHSKLSKKVPIIFVFDFLIKIKFNPFLVKSATFYTSMSNSSPSSDGTSTGLIYSQANSPVLYSLNFQVSSETPKILELKTNDLIG